MQQEFAEMQALAALTWLAGQDDIFGMFLDATGASAGDVRARAADAEFLASVIDFILMNDAWVVACADAMQTRPETLVQLRAALPGGDLPNWT
jgi:hypothetical protein